LIEAVANGKRAARSIHQHLSREAAAIETLVEIEKIPTRDYRMVAGFEIMERAALKNAASASGLPLSAMIKDDDRCIRCGLCAIRCPTDAMTMERFSITER